MTALLVMLGAAVGAPLRFLVDRWLRNRLFPWGTLVVNGTGSAVLGALAGVAVSDPVWAVAGIGFCGALTTYSTFGYEVYRLVEDRAYGLAALNVTANVVVGVGVAFAGLSTFGFGGGSMP